MNASHQVKVFSPLVAKVDIHKFGSNKNRTKLNYIPKLDLSRTRTMEPIIKGKNYKARESKKHVVKEHSLDTHKGKIKRESVKLEDKYE